MLKCRYGATPVYVLLLFTYYSCLCITPESFKVYKMSKLLSHDGKRYFILAVHMLLNSASLGLQEVHYAYVYAFGACDVHRHTITCPGLLNIVEKVDEYKGLSPAVVAHHGAEVQAAKVARKAT